MGSEHVPPGKSSAASQPTLSSASPATPGKSTLLGGLYLPSNLAGAPAPDLSVHAPEDLGDQIASFRIAIDKNDEQSALLAWGFAKPAEKRAFGASSTIDRELVSIARVMKGATVHIMAEAGVDFTNRDSLIEYMLEIGMPHWFDGISQYGGKLLSSFLDHLHPRDRIEGKALAKLDRMIRGMNSLPILRPMFERIYVPLADTSYNPQKVRTTAWQAEHIHRLYNVLSTHLPVAHVRTVRSFHLGSEVNDGGWKPLDYAWWNSAGYVVLPSKEATDGGGRTHRMTGGGRAQVEPGAKSKPSSEQMDKFDVGALHEVGHAVGGTLGGHAWAEKHPFVDWKTNMTVDAWSKGLWGDDAALSARARRTAGDDAINSSTARNYLAQELIGNGTLPPDQDSDSYTAKIIKQYGDQPLTKYFQKQEGADVSKMYLFNGHDNYGRDGRVYVYLSRGGSNYSSYRQPAHENKVSWYSLSSPHEWFAEQYAHYYRNGKSEAGLDAGTFKKLGELDTQQPAAAAPTPAPTSPGVDLDGEGENHRLPFPW